MLGSEGYRQMALVSGIFGVLTVFFVFLIIYDFSYFPAASLVYLVAASVLFYLISKLKKSTDNKKKF